MVLRGGFLSAFKGMAVREPKKAFNITKGPTTPSTRGSTNSCVFILLEYRKREQNTSGSLNLFQFETQNAT